MVSTRSIVISWDLGLGLLSGVVVFFLLPECLSNSFAKDVYLAGLSTLSIVFSVYFAGLAIIMSSAHDDFVKWLEERGTFTQLIDRLQYTLGALFVALMVSLLAYTVTSFHGHYGGTTQPRLLLSLYSFISIYALFATATAANASITYAKIRARYVSTLSNGDEQR